MREKDPVYHTRDDIWNTALASSTSFGGDTDGSIARDIKCKQTVSSSCRTLTLEGGVLYQGKCALILAVLKAFLIWPALENRDRRLLVVSGGWQW